MTMRTPGLICISAVLALGLNDCRNNSKKHNMLTMQEKKEGWELLFDGRTTDGWHSYLEDSASGWVVEEGTLKGLGKGGDIGGDIVSDKKFSNFELKLEWKIGAQGNSGILYLVDEDPEYRAVYETGPEYQLLDDLDFPQELKETQLTGSNYAMHPARNAEIKPAGEWNTAKIIVDNGHVEHWLNGKKVVEYEMWSDPWKKRVSQGKWKDYPGYGSVKKGHIALQDHGSFVWFRNIRIRELPEK